jgi:antitoxin VapB
MPLNIKNDEAHDLARELSELTHSSITDVVTLALREALARERRRLHQERLVGDLNRIAEDCAALRVLDSRSAEAILGYDQDGIPS